MDPIEVKDRGQQFWDAECKKLSRLLWIPPLNIDNLINKDESKKFREKCPNKRISFNFFSNDNPVNKKIILKDIPDIDNSVKKGKLHDKLFKKEFTRLDKEYAKNKIKYEKDNTIFLDKKFVSDPKNIIDKHCNFAGKIAVKVKQLDGFIRSRKTQILPTPVQKNIIQDWFMDCTYIYGDLVYIFNKVFSDICIETNFKNEGKDSFAITNSLIKKLRDNDIVPINFIKLRNLKIQEYIKLTDLPFCVVADMIKEFVTNIKSILTNLSKGHIKKFVLKPRKHNILYKSLPLESHYVTAKGFYPSIFGEMKTNDKTFEWKNVQHDFKLTYDKDARKYYVHVPKYFYPIEVENERRPICIGDPGEACFQTFYGLDHVVKIGEYMRKTIHRRLKRIDKMNKIIHTVNKTGKAVPGKKKNKYKVRRAVRREHRKITHLQQELHHKTANYLCENYDTIVTTEFTSRSVGRRGDLMKLVKRILGKLSHSKFKQILQQKCEKYGCKYLEVSEHWTSKTCCKCGSIKKVKRIYKCDNCDNNIDRDVNGSINILLRNRNLILEKY